MLASLTQDGSSIVRSSAQNGSSNASEFCSLSKPDSARSPLKVAEISLNEILHFFKLANFVFMITIFNQHQRLAQLNEPGNFKMR